MAENRVDVTAQLQGRLPVFVDGHEDDDVHGGELPNLMYYWCKGWLAAVCGKEFGAPVVHFQISKYLLEPCFV